MSESGSVVNERLQAMKSDASAVMAELTELSRKLKEIGKTHAGEIKEETLSELHKQLGNIQQRVGALAGDSKETIAALDKSVRANPYLWIAGALGLGLLLGKARRP